LLKTGNFVSINIYDFPSKLGRVAQWLYQGAWAAVLLQARVLLPCGSIFRCGQHGVNCGIRQKAASGARHIKKEAETLSGGKGEDWVWSRIQASKLSGVGCIDKARTCARAREVLQLH
jgi:hypothetical protein